MGAYKLNSILNFGSLLAFMHLPAPNLGSVTQALLRWHATRAANAATHDPRIWHARPGRRPHRHHSSTSYPNTSCGYKACKAVNSA